MNKKVLYTIIIIAVIVLLLIIVNISKNSKDSNIPQDNQDNVIDNSNIVNQDTDDSDTTITTETLSTCVELGGNICTVGIECTGEWLEATDTFDCCSVECGGEIITIDPFETNEEIEDLGGLE